MLSTEKRLENTVEYNQKSLFEFCWIHMSSLPSDSETQRFLSAQPLRQMQRLAELLGWNGLRLEYGRTPNDERFNEEIRGHLFVCYMTTDEKFNLQINTYPHDQTRRHQATVKAERYGIIHTEWQHFELPDDEASLVRLAETLKPLLKRSNFKDRAWRKEFAAQHPHLVHPKRHR